jgi:hypothetical protein
VQGQIVANHFNGASAFDATLFKYKKDDTNYGVLEVSDTDYAAMETSATSGGTYGKHVDDPEGTPVLADGDPT